MRLFELNRKVVWNVAAFELNALSELYLHSETQMQDARTQI